MKYNSISFNTSPEQVNISRGQACMYPVHVDMYREQVDTSPEQLNMSPEQVNVLDLY